MLSRLAITAILAQLHQKIQEVDEHVHLGELGFVTLDPCKAD